MPFTIDEVKNVLQNLKRAGPDNIMAEHLLAGGDAVAVWLVKICNSDP